MAGDADDPAKAGDEGADRAPIDGRVKWYSLTKGYGFLIPAAGGADVFVHHSEVVDGGELREGDLVTFEVADGAKGPQARRVERRRP